MLRRACLLIALVALPAACTLKEEPPPTAGGLRQIPPPPDVAGPPPDALRTPSGLASKVLQVGLGSFHPKPVHTVTVHYTGWTTDGKMFDSSIAKNEVARGKVTDFIPGWVEALQLMRMGEKRRFWIPAHLAYGDNPAGGQPAGMLVFEIELIDVR